MMEDDKAFWEIKGFKEYMEEYIKTLVCVFNEQARMSCVHRNELRAILLEEIEEMI